jgi:hypothetical protein
LREIFLLSVPLTRLVTAWYGAEIDRDSIPSVDRGNRKRQVNQVGFIEMFADRLKSQDP